jgi:CHASE3 domain sensor protein
MLRNPLLLLAGGVAGGIAVGYLLHKHEKEVIRFVSKAIGMGKDFAAQQRENLDDLIAEAQDGEAQAAAASPAAARRTGRTAAGGGRESLRPLA